MLILKLNNVLQEIDVVYCGLQNLPPAHLAPDPFETKNQFKCILYNTSNCHSGELEGRSAAF